MPFNLKILCGTDPFPKDFRAKKYKMDKHSITKVSFKVFAWYSYSRRVSLQAEFVQIMKSLPVCVPDDDIEEMFAFADKDNDGTLSYAEFKVIPVY